MASAAADLIQFVAVFPTVQPFGFTYHRCWFVQALPSLLPTHALTAGSRACSIGKAVAGDAPMHCWHQ